MLTRTDADSDGCWPRCRTGDGKEGRVIKRIKEGGPAAQSRRLAVGDRVLSVDEVLTESEGSLRARGH